MMPAPGEVGSPPALESQELNMDPLPIHFFRYFPVFPCFCFHYLRLSGPFT